MRSIFTKKSFSDRLSHYDLQLFIPFSILILFSIVRYLGFFQPTIYPTLNRATHILPFQNNVTQSPLIDQIIIVSLGLITLYFLIKEKKILPILGGFVILEIYLSTQFELWMDPFALLMIPAIISIIIANHFSHNKIIKKPPNWKNLFYITIVALFSYELFIIILWIAFPISPEVIKSSILWHPVSLEYEIFYSLALLSPAFIILTTFWFATRPLFSSILDFFNISIEKIQELSFSPNVIFNSKIMLSVAIAVSVVFAAYPYFPTLNPDYLWMSVDDRAYQDYLIDMGQNKNEIDLVQRAFKLAQGDRPLTLLIMYSFYNITGLELVTAVRFFPVLLGPGLVLAAYLFVNQGLKNNQYAGYAALLTAFSHQVVVSLYAGFFANWLGLIVLFLALMMINRFWEKPSIKNYLLVLGHSILSFLMYIYVDAYFLLVLLAFLVITGIKFRHNSEARKKILILSSIFGVYAVVFSIRILLGSSELYETVFERPDIEFSITEFRNRWLNFPKFMHYYVGGFFANSVLLAFTIVWTITARFDKTFDRILLATLLAGALPLLFGGVVLQSRIFLDMPIQIAASIAILKLVNYRGFNSKFAKIAFLLITIHFAIYTIRSLSNLNIQGI